MEIQLAAIVYVELGADEGRMTRLEGLEVSLQS
jgi:hypothetical protein